MKTLQITVSLISDYDSPIELDDRTKILFNKSFKVENDYYAGMIIEDIKTLVI